MNNLEQLLTLEAIFYLILSKFPSKSFLATSKLQHASTQYRHDHSVVHVA